MEIFSRVWSSPGARVGDMHLGKGLLRLHRGMANASIHNNLFAEHVSWLRGARVSSVRFRDCAIHGTVGAIRRNGDRKVCFSWELALGDFLGTTRFARGITSA